VGFLPGKVSLHAAVLALILSLGCTWLAFYGRMPLLAPTRTWEVIIS